MDWSFIFEHSMWAQIIFFRCNAILFPLIIFAGIILYQGQRSNSSGKLLMAVGGTLTCFALLTLFTGTAGYFIELLQVEEAMPNATPDTRDKLATMGQAYANAALILGFASGLIPLGLGIFTFWRGLTYHRSPIEEETQ